MGAVTALFGKPRRRRKPGADAEPVAAPSRNAVFSLERVHRLMERRAETIKHMETPR